MLLFFDFVGSGFVVSSWRGFFAITAVCERQQFADFHLLLILPL